MEASEHMGQLWNDLLPIELQLHIVRVAADAAIANDLNCRRRHLRPSSTSTTPGDDLEAPIEFQVDGDKLPPPHSIYHRWATVDDGINWEGWPHPTRASALSAAAARMTSRVEEAREEMKRKSMDVEQEMEKEKEREKETEREKVKDEEELFKEKGKEAMELEWRMSGRDAVGREWALPDVKQLVHLGLVCKLWQQEVLSERYWGRLLLHPAYEYRVKLSKIGIPSSISNMEHACLLHIMNTLYPTSHNGFLVRLNQELQKKFDLLKSLIDRKTEADAALSVMKKQLMSMYRQTDDNDKLEFEEWIKKVTLSTPMDLVQDILWLEYNFILLFKKVRKIRRIKHRLTDDRRTTAEECARLHFLTSAFPAAAEALHQRRMTSGCSDSRSPA